jgi:hypothetical protein
VVSNEADQGHAQGKECQKKIEDYIRLSAAAKKQREDIIRTTCAHCGVAETAGSVSLKPCSRCKAVVYCSKACQAQW